MTLAARIAESLADCEAWSYTSLDAFAAQNMCVCVKADDPVLPKALTQSRVVFVDGVFRRDLSSVDGMPDGFLNPCDSSPNCCAITLSGQTCLAIDPVELLFMNTPQPAPAESETMVKVALGANSRLTLIERHMGAGQTLQARHIAMQIDLSEQSKLIHGKVAQGTDTTLHFSRTKAIVAAGAFYDHFSLIKDGKLTRCEQDVLLQGQMGEARLLGVMLLRGASHGDMTTCVEHSAPCATSRQVCKTVLADKAHGVFQGKILVDKGAQKTDGHQLCRALLLSDKAEMDAKPELEIYADDVKCSHGTTIGDLDDSALFYLMSRGIDLPTARGMLVQAFVGELVDQLPSGPLQTLLQEEVALWLA